MSTTRTNAARRTRTAPDPHESLRVWLRLLACSNIVEGTVRSRLRDEFGITLPRFDVLAQLDAAARDDVQGLTMSELSRRLKPPGSVSGTGCLRPTRRERTAMPRATPKASAALSAGKRTRRCQR